MRLECAKEEAELSKLPPSPEAAHKGGTVLLCSALNSLASARVSKGACHSGTLVEAAWRLTGGDSLCLLSRMHG